MFESYEQVLRWRVQQAWQEMVKKLGIFAATKANNQRDWAKSWKTNSCGMRHNNNHPMYEVATTRKA